MITSIGAISMIREATAMTVRKNLGDLLNGVHYHHDTVLITKAGKPIAALVDIEFFEKAQRMKQEFERLCAELGKVYAGVDTTIAEAEIAEAVASVRCK